MGEDLPERPNASLRDEILFRLAKIGWGNDSGGKIGSSTGWYARLSNSEVEIPELIDALGDTMDELGFHNHERLIGHFLLVQLEPDLIEVEHYEDEDQVMAAFADRQERYKAWLAANRGFDEQPIINSGEQS